MFNIELDIFSGRVNPRWNLTESEQIEFLKMIINDDLPILPVHFVESKLGYRGFIVRAGGEAARSLVEKKLPREFRINANLAEMKNITGEELLLESLEEQDLDIPKEATDAARNEIQAEPTLDESETSGKRGLASCSHYVTSSTNFDFWNYWRYHRVNNNCYNYASNNRTNTFAQPGRGTGKQYTGITVDEVSAAAQRDGYQNSCEGGNLKVALVIWPNMDYHWYRQTKNVDGNPRWCHKAGRTRATNLDSSDNFITSPETCDRGNYTTWGGYLYGPGSFRETVA